MAAGPDFSTLPEILRLPAEQVWADCALAAAALPPQIQRSLPRVWGSSPFVRGWCRRHPQQFLELAASGWLSGELERGRLTEAIAALSGADFEAGLRQIRNREMVRIAWRELANLTTPDVTVAELSTLADKCIAAAWRQAWRELCERHGAPLDTDGAPAEGLVLALGKLGGRELNFSSDVDLIFVYSADGETAGERALDNASFFRRLTQRVTAMLSEVQADGFVFRVDTRLRPFGTAGPLAVSLAALEDYYTAHGREWERYALIKARPAAGSDQLWQEVRRLVQPFVYRRYLDYGAIDALREMKAEIDEQVRRRGHEEDIKLGWGGIREVEFLIQVFQLIRGGSDIQLQSSSLLSAMAATGRLGLLPAESLAELREAYWFLRRVENCWQAQEDKQVHVLPSREAPRRALALALDYPDWAAFTGALQQRRAAVHAQFQKLFAEQPQIDPEQASLLRRWWAGEAVELGLEPGEAAALEAVRAAAGRRVGDPADVEELLELVATLWDAAREQAAFAVVLSVVEVLAGRANYVSLLRESAFARRALIELCAASAWLARELRLHPALLGELVDPVTLYAPDAREALRERLQANLQAQPEDDDEARMDALRRARQAATLRIAAADLSAALPIMRVSDRLSELAEEVLAGALTLTTDQMRRRYPDLPPLSFAIVAYGKLGGYELGYTSDLDLVFLYDATDCALPTEAQLFYTRFTQKLIHCLATPTGAGLAYEVDTRLRPSGASGLLVTTVSALASYQKEQAWTWEHQALIRARPVVGSAAVGDAFEALRREVLCQPRDAARLRAEVLEMRAKMRNELAPADGGFDIKQSPGGIADIEFLVQFLILRHAADHPSVVEYTDVCRHLEALAAAGCLSSHTAEMLADGWTRLRAATHRQFLSGLSPAERAETEALAARLADRIPPLYETP